MATLAINVVDKATGKGAFGIPIWLYKWSPIDPFGATFPKVALVQAQTNSEGVLTIQDLDAIKYTIRSSDDLNILTQTRNLDMTIDSVSTSVGPATFGVRNGTPFMPCCPVVDLSFVDFIVVTFTVTFRIRGGPNDGMITTPTVPGEFTITTTTPPPIVPEEPDPTSFLPPLEPDGPRDEGLPLTPARGNGDRPITPREEQHTEWRGTGFGPGPAEDVCVLIGNTPGNTEDQCVLGSKRLPSGEVILPREATTSAPEPLLTAPQAILLVAAGAGAFGLLFAATRKKKEK